MRSGLVAKSRWEPGRVRPPRRHLLLKFALSLVAIVATAALAAFAAIASISASDGCGGCDTTPWWAKALWLCAFLALLVWVAAALATAVRAVLSRRRRLSS